MRVVCHAERSEASEVRLKRDSSLRCALFRMTALAKPVNLSEEDLSCE